MKTQNEQPIGAHLVEEIMHSNRDILDLLSVRKQLWSSPDEKTAALSRAFHAFSDYNNQMALMVRHMTRFAKKHGLKYMSRNHIVKSNGSILETHTGGGLIHKTRVESSDDKGKSMSLLSIAGAEIQSGANPVYDVVLSGTPRYMSVTCTPLTLCFTHHFLQRFDERSGLRDAKPTLRSFMDILMKYPFKLVFTTQRSGAWFKSYFCVKLPDRVLFIAAPCLMFQAGEGEGLAGSEKYVIFMKTILDGDDDRFHQADEAHNLARDWDALPTDGILLYAANYNTPDTEQRYLHGAAVMEKLKEDLE